MKHKTRKKLKNLYSTNLDILKTNLSSLDFNHVINYVNKYMNKKLEKIMATQRKKIRNLKIRFNIPEIHNLDPDKVV